MSREAIEKAVREAEAELALTQGDVWCSGPVTREVWRANVLRSLVDAVLEEAYKAQCPHCRAGVALAHDGRYWWHPPNGYDCLATKLRPAPQEPAKP